MPVADPEIAATPNASTLTPSAIAAALPSSLPFRGIETLGVQLLRSNEQDAVRRHEHGCCVCIKEPLSLGAIKVSHVHAADRRLGNVIQEVATIGKELRESLTGPCSPLFAIQANALARRPRRRRD